MRTPHLLLPLLLLLTACSAPNNISTILPIAPPTIVYPSAKPRFAYIGNQAASISAYSVDPSTGVLTPTGTTATGISPTAVVHDPTNHFLISADISAEVLRVFTIDPTSGALTPLGPPAPTGRQPRDLTIDPSGRFIYVSSQFLNSVAGFTLSPAGTLAPIPGSPFPTSTTGGSFGDGITTDPAGKFLFVEDDTNIYSYSISPSTGALTLVSTLKGPGPVGGLAVNAAGTFLYAVGASPAVLTYAINAATGALTLAATSPLLTGPGSGAYSIVIEPTGRFAYTSEGVVVPYSISGPNLTPLGPSYPGARSTNRLAIDPSGHFLYAPQLGYVNNASGFRIATDGTLSALPGSPYPTGGQPFAITITAQ